MPERPAVKHAITHGAAVEGSRGSAAGGGAAAVAAPERQEAVNWASPATTFPMVVGLLAVPEYHNAIGERGREMYPPFHTLSVFRVFRFFWGGGYAVPGCFHGR